LPRRRALIASAAAVDFAFAVLLTLVWAIENPRDDADAIGSMVLVAFLSVLFCGVGWYAVSLGGGLAACCFQVLRFGALAALVWISFSAFNLHMDNPCNRVVDDACSGHARNWFFAIYASLAVSPLASAVLLWRNLGARRRLHDDAI